MQRLFTTFAAGWPGCGLLVQRVVIGITLLQQCMMPLNDTGVSAPVPEAIGSALAIFLMIGLWCPFTGVVVAGFEIWIALLHPGNLRIEILLATFGATLAMIGPGAFSIDARLFGRKQIQG